MGRPAYRPDCADLERFTREQNQYCSRSLLEALVANHGGELPVVEPEPIPKPEPTPRPVVVLPPIPNEVMAEAAAIVFPNWVNAIKRIQHAVCAEYNITMMELCSQRRSKEIVRPRQIAMYLCKKLTDRSFPEIGRRFGGRDHSTAISAIRRVESLCAADEEFRLRVETVAAGIGEPVA
jgi:hypothetical protein